MKPLTAEQTEEAKIIIPWKVWSWAGAAGQDIFYGYIGYEQPNGVVFPHVPAYLRDEFNKFCNGKMQAQKEARQ